MARLPPGTPAPTGPIDPSIIPVPGEFRFRLDAESQLPSELALDGATGEISGTPQTPGEFRVQVNAMRGRGERGRIIAELWVQITVTSP